MWLLMTVTIWMKKMSMVQERWVQAHIWLHQKQKNVEEAQQDVQDTFLLYFMLKPPLFITQGFKENKESQDKLFTYM